MSANTTGEDVANGLDTNIMNCGPNMDSNISPFTGGEELRQFAAKYSLGLAWVAMISVFIILTIFILWTMGYVTFGKTTVSSYSSSFITPIPKTNNYIPGNHPNWRMTAGDAGFGSGIDIPGAGKSLGFDSFNNNKCPHQDNMRQQQPGVSNFADSRVQELRRQQEYMEQARRQHEHMEQARRQQEHMEQARRQQENMEQARRQQENMEQARRVEIEAKAKAQAELAKREREARQSAYESQYLQSCEDKWDPMAIEEAKALTTVGSYQQRSPGMGTFNSVINPKSNVVLTDAQLEAIMQGGEPFTVDRFDQQLPITNSQLTNKPIVRYQ
jgi:hypothetical protein